MRSAVALFSVAVLVASPRARAADAWSDPFPGVRHLHRTTSNQSIHALVVDLCAAGVSVRATAHGERGKRVSAFGASVSAQAAINGDFFSSGFSTDGLAMSGGALWPGEADHGYVAPIAFGDRRVGLIPHEVVAGAEPWMREIVSGHPTVLAGGVIRDNNGDAGLCAARHPRTAVGLSADKTKLYMVVVDGRATTRIGMTCGELAGLLQELGAHDALNLDGGGSSAMWLGGSVVNSPSDGSERTVANHLAIFARGTGDPTSCPIPRWKGTFVSAPGWPTGTTMILPVGTTAKGCIEMRNEGTETWSPQKTLLATTQPRDRKSVVRADDWISDNRAASVDVSVAPGSTGKFCFTVKAPATPQELTEHFNLVQEGVQWFSDSGGPGDDAMWLKITAVPATATDAGVIDAASKDATGVDAARDDATPPEDASISDEDGGDDAGDDASPTPDATDDGNLEGSCGCRVAPARTSLPNVFAVMTALAFVASRRLRSAAARRLPAARDRSCRDPRSFP